MEKTMDWNNVINLKTCGCAKGGGMGHDGKTTI